MIYRIKIVKDGKFVRYATDEEMTWLRPKADGSGVERLIGKNDVSDTHKVEWGVITSDKHCNRIPIYEGDIYVDYENIHSKSLPLVTNTGFCIISRHCFAMSLKSAMQVMASLL